jgi:hypothetical protein
LLRFSCCRDDPVRPKQEKARCAGKGASGLIIGGGGEAFVEPLRPAPCAAVCSCRGAPQLGHRCCNPTQRAPSPLLAAAPAGCHVGAVLCHGAPFVTEPADVADGCVRACRGAGQRGGAAAAAGRAPGGQRAAPGGGEPCTGHRKRFCTLRMHAEAPQEGQRGKHGIAPGGQNDCGGQAGQSLGESAHSPSAARPPPAGGAPSRAPRPVAAAYARVRPADWRHWTRSTPPHPPAQLHAAQTGAVTMRGYLSKHTPAGPQLMGLFAQEWEVRPTWARCHG